MMSYRISHADGRQETHESLSRCHASLVKQWPDVVFCDNGEAVSHPYERQIAEAGRILVWACEEDSEDDGGQNAVAAIVHD